MLQALTFLFVAAILAAQPSTPPSVIYVTSDPAGACAANVQLRFNTSNGKLWGCNALTWGQIGGGGGGGTVSSATVNQLAYYTAATTVGGSGLQWNNADVGEALHSGSGLNDAVFGGSYTDLAHPGYYMTATISLGTISLSNGTNANPVHLATAGAYAFSNGDSITISGVSAPPWNAINGTFTITTVDATHFTIPVDSTTFGGFPGGDTVLAHESSGADKFQWQKCAPDGTCGSLSSVTSITGAAQTLSDGVTITFGATTGHLQGDVWTSFLGEAVLPLRMELPATTRDFPAVIYADGDGNLEMRANGNSYWLQYSASAQSVWIFKSSFGTTSVPTNLSIGDPVGSIAFDPFIAGRFYEVSGINATLAADQPASFGIDYNFETGSGNGLKVYYSGAVGIPACTAATLSTALVNNGDQCMCTDCKPTSGSDDTCTGSGAYWLAYKTAGGNVCR